MYSTHIIHELRLINIYDSFIFKGHNINILCKCYSTTEDFDIQNLSNYVTRVEELLNNCSNVIMTYYYDNIVIIFNFSGDEMLDIKHSFINK